MQSPPVEWALGVGYLALLDVIRDRGEADGDTLSECIREAFRVETGPGRVAFSAVLAGGAALFWRHIVKT